MGRVAPPPLLKQSTCLCIYIVDINMHDIQLHIHVQCIFVTGVILTQPNGFFQHQLLPRLDSSSELGPPVTVRGRGFKHVSMLCCKNTLRKWLGGWWMPHYATLCLMNLDELGFGTN